MIHILTQSKAFSSFPVDDLKKAKDFYEGILGLNVTEMPEGLNLELEGGTHVFIYPVKKHNPAGYTILNFPVEHLETTMEQMKMNGIQFEKYEGTPYATDEKGIFRKGGPLIAWFKDPAGNVLSVLEKK